MDQETIWTTLERLGAVRRGHFRGGNEHAVDIRLDTAEVREADHHLGRQALQRRNDLLA